MFKVMATVIEFDKDEVYSRVEGIKKMITNPANKGKKIDI
jgi:hypothetical protein